MEGQLCPLHHSPWPLCFGGLVQELIQLTGEQLSRALNECLVSKIYGCQGSGLLTRAVHFFLQMPAGDMRDICLQGRINDILYFPTWQDIVNSLEMRWIYAGPWCSHSRLISERSNPVFLAVAVGSGPPWQSKDCVCIVPITALCSDFSWCRLCKWSSPISTLRFAERCLYVSLVVLVACLSSLQWQTHISRSMSGEQVPAFLKINLLFWSSGVIGTERLPARIHSLQSKGAKWAALARFGWTRNRLLGAWPFSPSLNLDSPIPACISPWC